MEESEKNRENEEMKTVTHLIKNTHSYEDLQNCVYRQSRAVVYPLSHLDRGRRCNCRCRDLRGWTFSRTWFLDGFAWELMGWCLDCDKGMKLSELLSTTEYNSRC